MTSPVPWNKAESNPQNTWVAMQYQNPTDLHPRGDAEMQKSK